MRYLLVLALPALASCDPLFTTQFRQGLTPSPEPACIEGALRASPLAAIVWRDTTDRPRGAPPGYVVTVRDSLTPGGGWTARVVQGGAADSAWAQVSYSYMGYATPRPAERARFAAQARELLEAVRARCAPASTLGIRCRSVSGFGGQRGACRS